jgi:phosphotriesterase-related protein
VTPVIEKALRAAARAHRATGVPITTHTDAAKETGTLQQDIFESEGVDLNRVIIGHSGDSTDIAYLTHLISRGSYIGMDRFGLDNFLPTPERVATIASLCDTGYADRLVLSQDAICYVEWWNRTALRKALPNWHHSYLAGEVLAALSAAGVTEEQIERMTIANPRSIFERRDPY